MPCRRLSIRNAGLLALACLGLAACASYTRLPLPMRPALAESLDGLQHDGIALDAPLSVAEVADLAVRNSPDLRAVRTQHGVSQAQLFQAGILPNPAITGSVLPLAAGGGGSGTLPPSAGGGAAGPQSSAASGTTLAWNAGISFDVRALITLAARRRSAREAAAQVDAQILWQEWQTMGQARLLAVDIIEGEKNRHLLTRARDLFAARNARSQKALATGNVTLATTAPDLAALQSARAAVDSQERLQLARRHQLNALLGLEPDVRLSLAVKPDLPKLNPDRVREALPTLAERRPDLVALRLGYRAANASLRAAILGQFPNFSIGVTGGSDNFNVRNVGPQISMDLPIFDRNQGNVAVARATRGQLHTEYAARLAAADGQVRAMLTETALLEAQLDATQHDLPGMRRTAEQASAAYDAGNLDERSYLDLVIAEVTKEQEIVTIELSLLEQRVAIATLLGAGLPPVSLPPDEARS